MPLLMHHCCANIPILEINWHIESLSLYPTGFWLVCKGVLTSSLQQSVDLQVSSNCINASSRSQLLVCVRVCDCCPVGWLKCEPLTWARTNVSNDGVNHTPKPPSDTTPITMAIVAGVSLFGLPAYSKLLERSHFSKVSPLLRVLMVRSVFLFLPAVCNICTQSIPSPDILQIWKRSIHMHSRIASNTEREDMSVVGCGQPVSGLFVALFLCLTNLTGTRSMFSSAKPEVHAERRAWHRRGVYTADLYLIQKQLINSQPLPAQTSVPNTLQIRTQLENGINATFQTTLTDFLISSEKPDSSEIKNISFSTISEEHCNILRTRGEEC